MSTAPAHTRPIVAVSMGDPAGIGAEIIVKALADKVLRAAARFHILGLAACLEAAAVRAGISPFWWRIQHGSRLAETVTVHDAVVFDYPEFSAFLDTAAAANPGPSKAGGEASFRFVEDAISAAQLPRENPLHAVAIVTAPISKTSWDLAGRSRYPGHTELLAERFRTKRTAMMFFGPTLRVALVTVHIPLMEIRDVLTIGRVFDTIDLGHEACRAAGIGAPRIAVCGLNPHAGEDGLMGDEEARIIKPAIQLASDNGIDARGPYAADAVFLDAAKGKFDLVVAMYHDQGLIPVKLLDRERAVNVTVGLPGGAIRTSPAHGTAFDIAGKNLASPGSMHAAIELAIKMFHVEHPTP